MNTKNIFGWIAFGFVILCIVGIGCLFLGYRAGHVTVPATEVTDKKSEQEKPAQTGNDLKLPPAQNNSPASTSTSTTVNNSSENAELNGAVASSNVEVEKFAEGIKIEEPRRGQKWDNVNKVWVDGRTGAMFVLSPNVLTFDGQGYMWSASFEAFAMKYPARARVLRAQYQTQPAVYLNEGYIVATYGPEARPRR